MKRRTFGQLASAAAAMAMIAPAELLKKPATKYAYVLLRGILRLPDGTLVDVADGIRLDGGHLERHNSMGVWQKPIKAVGIIDGQQVQILRGTIKCNDMVIADGVYSTL